MSAPKPRVVQSNTDPLSQDPTKPVDSGDGRELALTILWARKEPQRPGEIAFLGRRRGRLGESWILGRGDGGEPNRVHFHRQGPGELEPMGPILSSAMSGVQSSFTRTQAGLAVKRHGQRLHFLNGVACEEGFLNPGGTLLIEDQMLLLCVERARQMPRLHYFPRDQAGPFGEINKLHFVGESPLLWELLDLIAMVARVKGDAHALIRGDTGTGKELVAKAIHELSDRSGMPIISCNATNLAQTLLEVLLFGNAKNFPNPGTRATIGLIGEAHLGTLFLDELGEIPHEMQARLLRFLDKGGEYIRMGVPGKQSADVRVVAATNRRLDEMKFDLVPRLKLRIEVPPLEARREDIPLILRHLLVEIARKNPTIAGKFVREVHGREEPRMEGPFVDALVRRSHPLNVRGLEETLWVAIARNKEGDVLTASKEMLAEAAGAASKGAIVEDVSEGEPTPRIHQDPDAQERERLLAALGRNRWKMDPTAKDLGLTDRHALRRLMEKLKITK